VTADARQIQTISLLDEPLRRRLYEYVRDRRDAVGRDEAAGACGISRSLAAFHLDRLVEGGLLSVEYRRLTGRTGRGAGRPAKLYRPSGRRFRVTLPETRYALAGRVLADAVEERRTEESAQDAVSRVASRAGQDLGGQLRREARSTRAAPLTVAKRALQHLGFEPMRIGGRVVLRNCPFHDLVQAHPTLVCAMNRALLLGILEGLGTEGLTAGPWNEPGYCCVEVRPA